MPTLEGEILWSGEVVLSESMRIDAECTLEILPGTIVRLQSGVGLFVEGRINAIGELRRDVRFEGEASNLGLVLLAGSQAHIEGVSFESVRVEVQDAIVESFQDVEMSGARQSLLVHSAQELDLIDVSVRGGDLAMDISRVRRLGLEDLEVEGAMRALRIDGVGRRMDVALSNSNIVGWFEGGIFARNVGLRVSNTNLRGGAGDALRAQNSIVELDSSEISDVMVGAGLLARGGRVRISDAILRDLEGAALDLGEADLVAQAFGITGVQGGAGLMMRGGTADIDDGTLSDVEGDGVVLSGVTFTAQDFHVSQIRSGNGLVALSGVVSIEDSSFVDIDGDGLRLDELNALLSGLTLRDLRVGVRSSVGTIEVLDSNVAGMDAQAFYARSGDLRIVRTLIDNTGSHGIAQDTGTLFMCLVTLTNARRHGVWADEAVNADIRESTITGSGNYGLFLLGGASIFDSVINDNRRGIYLGGTQLSSIRDTVVADNAEFGIHSHANRALPNLVNVFGGEVRDNGSFGIRDVQQVGQVLVSGNNGSTETLDSSLPVGTLDGVFDTSLGDPVQVLNVDVFGACTRLLRLDFSAENDWQNLRVNGNVIDAGHWSPSTWGRRSYDLDVFSGTLVLEVDVQETSWSYNWGSVAHVLVDRANLGTVDVSGDGEAGEWQFMAPGETQFRDGLACTPINVGWMSSRGAQGVTWQNACGGEPADTGWVAARVEIPLDCSEPAPFTPPPPPTNRD